MKIDLYKRPEAGGQFSYLAVPQGRPIPEEATNTDWETVEQAIDLERSDQQRTGLTLNDVSNQFDEKGYAISSVALLDERARMSR